MQYFPDKSKTMAMYLGGLDSSTQFDLASLAEPNDSAVKVISCYLALSVLKVGQDRGVCIAFGGKQHERHFPPITIVVNSKF
jgi:hypothetical protein